MARNLSMNVLVTMSDLSNLPGQVACAASQIATTLTQR
jgi:hypothetical protein